MLPFLRKTRHTHDSRAEDEIEFHGKTTHTHSAEKVVKCVKKIGIQTKKDFLQIAI